MKVSKEHYELLKNGVKKNIEYVKIIYLLEDAKEYYLKRMNLSEERFRWDMMWQSIDNGFTPKSVIAPYHDNHIDTALKQIIKELSQ
jgi:hypothetical protein